MNNLLQNMKRANKKCNRNLLYISFLEFQILFISSLTWLIHIFFKHISSIITSYINPKLPSEATKGPPIVTGSFVGGKANEKNPSIINN